MTAPVIYRDACLDCAQPFLALSHDALMAAVDDHVHYVNTTLDQATDPHFELIRMNRLLADQPLATS